MIQYFSNFTEYLIRRETHDISCSEPSQRILYPLCRCDYRRASTAKIYVFAYQHGGIGRAPGVQGAIIARGNPRPQSRPMQIRLLAIIPFVRPSISLTPFTIFPRIGTSASGGSLIGVWGGGRLLHTLYAKLLAPRDDRGLCRYRSLILCSILTPAPHTRAPTRTVSLAFVTSQQGLASSIVEFRYFAPLSFYML